MDPRGGEVQHLWVFKSVGLKPKENVGLPIEEINTFEASIHSKKQQIMTQNKDTKVTTKGPHLLYLHHNFLPSQNSRQCTLGCQSSIHPSIRLGPILLQQRR